MARPGAQHSFVEKTFGKPTHCNHCSKLLWGVTKQGLQCQGCGTTSHKRCEDYFTTPCNQTVLSVQHFYNDPLDQDEVPPNSRLARQRTNLTVTTTALSKVTVAPVKRSKSSLSLPSSPTSSQNGDKKNAGSLVQDLFLTTAYNQLQMQKNSEAPSLNLLTTTPKNFTRFVSKVGPVFAFQEAIEKVVTWDSPAVTLLAMVAWTILCKTGKRLTRILLPFAVDNKNNFTGLHPVLLFICPQLFLLYRIFDNYYAKARYIAASMHAKKTVTTADSVQYKKNMQNIQNSMGLYCEAHDNLVIQARILNWSDEDATMSVTKLLVASIPVTLIVFWIIPWNYAILAGGLMPLIANTALVRASATILAPYFTEKIRVNVDRAKKVIVNHITPGSSGPKMKQVRVYENGRWWAGLGFTHRMNRSDPPAWADENNKSLPPKDLLSAPVGYAFLPESEWVLDYSFSDVCDSDEKGWVYTDGAWENPRKRSTLLCVTRCRCWVRDVVELPSTQRENEEYDQDALSPETDEDFDQDGK